MSEDTGDEFGELPLVGAEGLEVGGDLELDRAFAEAAILEAEAAEPPPKTGLGRFRLGKPKRTTRRKPADQPRIQVGPRERLLILDTWLRSKLPAKDFGPMVGVSSHTLYTWKRAFEESGPAGLEDKPRGAPKGSRLPEETKRAILLLKECHEDWGLLRIHDVLLRSQGCAASPGAIRTVLEEAGYEVEGPPVRSNPTKEARRKGAERPNQKWQTDLFTFVLKRENRRVYVVVFLDEFSRFIVSWGIYASQSGALVRETFKQAVANFGKPEVVQSDRGTQYYSPTSESAFEKMLRDLGIQHKVIVDPKKNGRVERFWGTLWREFLEKALFQGLDDARSRLEHFVGHYNFQRPHQGLGGLVPADQYFQAAVEVSETLRQRVAANALELAQHGVPRKSFYLTGRVGDESISLHAEGPKVVLTKEDGRREEVDLSAEGLRATHAGVSESPFRSPVLPPLLGTEDDSREWPPGTSPLDEGLRRLEEGLRQVESASPEEADADAPPVALPEREGGEA